MNLVAGAAIPSDLISQFEALCIPLSVASYIPSKEPDACLQLASPYLVLPTSEHSSHIATEYETVVSNLVRSSSVIENSDDLCASLCLPSANSNLKEQHQDGVSPYVPLADDFLDSPKLDLCDSFKGHMAQSALAPTLCPTSDLSVSCPGDTLPLESNEPVITLDVFPISSRLIPVSGSHVNIHKVFPYMPTGEF
jgi:hypothetical protein